MNERAKFMKKILVVDDHEPLRKAVRLVLESKGKELDYSVLEAENGREALRLVMEEKPDLAIVDLMMPEVDGFTMLNEIKLANNDMPVIILTAKTDPATAEEVKKNYPSYIMMTKPADNQALFFSVKGLLEKSA